MFRSRPLVAALALVPSSPLDNVLAHRDAVDQGRDSRSDLRLASSDQRPHTSKPRLHGRWLFDDRGSDWRVWFFRLARLVHPDRYHTFSRRTGIRGNAQHR
jgi:hypothetical protein